MAFEDEKLQERDTIFLRHPTDQTKRRKLKSENLSKIEPLLVSVMDGGDIVYDPPGLDEIRTLREKDMNRLYPGVKRVMNPHHYHVSLTQKLWDLKQELIREFADGERDLQI